MDTQLSTVVSREPQARWVSEKLYADMHGLSPQTLRNWRYMDRQAGRDVAAPGYPRYRRFGRAVRYWLEVEDVSGPT